MDYHMAKYRVTGTGVDFRSDCRDALIRAVSGRHGVYVLWRWAGARWTREETFLF